MGSGGVTADWVSRMVLVLQLHPRMNPPNKSSRVTKVVFAALAALAALYGRALGAQDLSPLLAASSKIEAPKPKEVKPPRSVTRPRFALDRASVTLGLLQGGVELFDGVATHRFVRTPGCPYCVEVDPICRLFLGPKPTWPRMLTLGTMEAFGGAYLHQGMRRSPHKLVRWLAPVVPLTLTGIHLEQGLRIFAASTNPCSPLGPGYSVVSQSPSSDAVVCRRPNPAVQAARLAPPRLLRLQ
jgi:hypothetical protein